MVLKHIITNWSVFGLNLVARASIHQFQEEYAKYNQCDSLQTAVYSLQDGSNLAAELVAHYPDRVISDESDDNEGGDRFSNDIEITQELYDRLVYFSKICALSYCISKNELFPGKTLADGACPSRLRFCSDENVNPTIHKTKVELVLLADKHELGTGYVAVDHKKKLVMLVFRGSTTNQDWLSDFMIYPVSYLPSSREYYDELVEEGTIRPCKGCMLYSGFHLFLRTLSTHFFEHIESISRRHPGYRLVVTGHSLGAALAILAGIELKLRGFDPLVLTYACPNIFNSALRDWVDELFESDEIHAQSVEERRVIFERGYFRVVHMQDYITMIPPFYKPAGLEIFIKKLFLPHGIEDLVYKGFQPGLLLPQPDPDGVTGSGAGQGNRWLVFAEKWLHMYEHRAYFLLINTCEGF